MHALALFSFGSCPFCTPRLADYIHHEGDCAQYADRQQSAASTLPRIATELVGDQQT
jgi:hypothetical protein